MWHPAVPSLLLQSSPRRLLPRLLRSSFRRTSAPTPETCLISACSFADSWEELRALGWDTWSVAPGGFKAGRELGRRRQDLNFSPSFCTWVSELARRGEQRSDGCCGAGCWSCTVPGKRPNTGWCPGNPTTACHWAVLQKVLLAVRYHQCKHN